jgi:hypothetical protein
MACKLPGELRGKRGERAGKREKRGKGNKKYANALAFGVVYISCGYEDTVSGE